MPTNGSIDLHNNDFSPSIRPFLLCPLAVVHYVLKQLLLSIQSQGGVTQVKLVTTKLGGQLEPFADVSKGYRLAKPLGWNRYDGTSGEYTVKMVDIVDPTTLILLTNSPVKSDTEVNPVK